VEPVVPARKMLFMSNILPVIQQLQVSPNPIPE